MIAPILLAHVTDTHVVAPGTDAELFVDNNGRLAEVVARLGTEAPAPAAVIATGDLVNDGGADEYESLAALVAPLAVPFLPIPGNHDDRQLLRATFPDTPWVDADHASWEVVIDGARKPTRNPTRDPTRDPSPGAPHDDQPAGGRIGGVRVVGLDSMRPGHPGACFDDDRESWLRSVLGRAHTGPTVLAIHHPPFVTGIGWMDRSGFVGVERLAGVLAEHPVDRVICGHLHRPITSTIAGIPVQVGLSPVPHVNLDLDPAARVSLVLDPVGYQLLVLSGDHIVTHTRYVAPVGEPFAPSWASEYE